MGRGFDFSDLFVFDLANNHQGNVDHGLRIIREVADVAKGHGIRAGIKFQFRQLDTFIHPSHRNTTDNKHIPRFLSTKLSRKDFESLLLQVKKKSLISICTPFDEASVDVLMDMEIEVIKVASCSATDWPLLEKIAEAGKPVIFSTGGLHLKNIDDLVSFFDHRGVEYAIMHCVSIYPIPNPLFNLSQIDLFRNRYPNRVIGWSTHEDPNETTPIQIAVAKGARMFERHVGIATDKIKLNAYSSTPEQVDRWISSYKKAKEWCGSLQRPEPTDIEVDSIKSLRRGVYAKKLIGEGTKLEEDQVYFAMPYIEGQLTSGDWKTGITVMEAVEADAPVMIAKIESPPHPNRLILQAAVHEVKAILNDARIPLNSEFKVEYSHHYGIENFRKTGAVLIDCINRAYCKKVIIQLPGQEHPNHFHKRKEETFHVLYGILHVEVDGHHRVISPGETILIQSGVWHRFWTEVGTVFEEISTTHYNDDSYYQDKKINRMERSERKTIVDHWGRFQLVSESNG